MRAWFWGWLTTKHRRIGASLVRVSLGLWAVYFYILHWPHRHYLWGPNGVLPFEKFLEMKDTPNVFAFSSSPGYFEAVYVAAIAVSILVTVGVFPHLFILIHWFVIWSMQERNLFLGDGGDNIMRIVLLFLVLVDTGSYCSVDAALRKSSTRSLAKRWVGLRTFLNPSLAVIHNVGVLLIVAQLCFMYMSTGLYKAMGELWQNGTALYYILRVDEFTLPGVAEFIYRNLYLVVIGTYATVLFEILFVPSLLNRWTRYLMIAIGFCFHLSIAVIMGLVTFGWSMLSIYPLLITDREYLRAIDWIRSRFRLTLLYDADCAFCTRFVRLMEAANLFSLVKYVPYQQPGILSRYGIPLSRAERRMQSIAPDGKVTEGMISLLQICGRSPALWPLLPMVWIGRIFFGQRLYDLAASRRHRFMRGSCVVRPGLAGNKDCAQ